MVERFKPLSCADRLKKDIGSWQKVRVMRQPGSHHPVAFEQIEPLEGKYPVISGVFESTKADR
jgi:hypothetical protein